MVVWYDHGCNEPVRLWPTHELVGQGVNNELETDRGHAGDLAAPPPAIIYISARNSSRQRLYCSVVADRVCI